MITADQLVAHAVGDYVLQSDWMASKKRTEHGAALVHATVYGLCFLPFLFVGHRHPFSAYLVIVWTHFFIDRYGLARYVVWAKNFLAPRWLFVPFDRPGTMERNRPWAGCAATGYPSDRPAWLAVWLLIAADNILHVLINALALMFL